MKNQMKIGTAYSRLLPNENVKMMVAALHTVGMFDIVETDETITATTKKSGREVFVALKKDSECWIVRFHKSLFVEA